MKAYIRIFSLACISASVLLIGGLGAAFAAPAASAAGKTEATEAVPAKIEVVFVLDTTGSMGDMIQTAKDKIWSITNMLARAKPTPQIKMGLVAYRDRGDVYITKITPLTTALDAVYKDLVALQADGGGDEPESVNQALHDAVTKIAWSTDQETYRVMFLVGDAQPHMDYPDDVKYPVTCKLAAKMGININTILCGNSASAWKYWQDIATLAQGESCEIQHSGGAAQTPATPYDSSLLALSMDLDGTRVYYGTATERATGEQQRETTREVYTTTAKTALADRAGVLVADSKATGTGMHDLVTDVESGRVKVENVDPATLPDYLRDKPLAAREKYIAKLVALRKEARTEISELAAKRQAWLLNELKKMGADTKGTVDLAIFVAVKDQAEKKGMKY